jgi:Cu2+-exporting ATPase
VTHLGGAADGQTVPVEEVSAGMCYSLRPGEINPVAADPLDGEGTLSLEWINGEPEPVIWPQTRITPAGAINVGLGPLRFRARESWADSLLAHLLERPEDTFRERRLQSVLKHYIAVVLLVAFFGGAAWMALTGNPLMATQVLISVLIVSCPCALGIALPMCDEFAIARLRRAGLFVKSAQIWERLRQVRTVVFDKTGTLTMDIPKLRNPEAVAELDPLAAEALGHMVEGNRHPVARALREALLASYPLLHEREPAARANRSTSVLVRSPAVIEETIGQGVAWTDAGGNRWTLGKPHWHGEGSAKNAEPKCAHTVLRQNGLLVAGFDFQEDVRDDAREAINSLTARGLTTVILSGDTAERVAPIARQLGLEAEAACSPQDKADWVERHAPGEALMIGDGANDSLAFDSAICRGTPVVDASILEARADFFFFGRSLQSLPLLFKIARQRRRTVSLIFVFAVIYNITAVGVCLAGLMHPLLAAIVMPLSSLATLAMAWLGLGRFEASGPPG